MAIDLHNQRGSLRSVDQILTKDIQLNKSFFTPHEICISVGDERLGLRNRISISDFNRRRIAVLGFKPSSISVSKVERLAKDARERAQNYGQKFHKESRERFAGIDYAAALEKEDSLRVYYTYEYSIQGFEGDPKCDIMFDWGYYYCSEGRGAKVFVTEEKNAELAIWYRSGEARVRELWNRYYTLRKYLTTMIVETYRDQNPPPYKYGFNTIAQFNINERPYFFSVRTKFEGYLNIEEIAFGCEGWSTINLE